MARFELPAQTQCAVHSQVSDMHVCCQSPKHKLLPSSAKGTVLGTSAAAESHQNSSQSSVAGLGYQLAGAAMCEPAAAAMCAGRYVLTRNFKVRDRAVWLRGDGIGISCLVWPSAAKSVGVGIVQVSYPTPPTPPPPGPSGAVQQAAERRQTR